MEIISKTSELKFLKPLDINQIQNFFENNNIKPLRWAITSVQGDTLKISYSFIN